jgi:thiol-disulfide isomerase/thioredoxin
MEKRARVRAPELVGRGGWINTGDRELSLAALRGRIVILDFWTFCCVNCLHALDELRELEERHKDTVVIVGVHSPKFTHEAEHRAVLDAVERYGVEHPVLDDPERVTWRQYAVRAWPTLAVIDPEGYVVAQYAGEGHAHANQRLVEELEAQHAAKGTLRRGDAPYVAPEPQPTTLRFPGKAVPLPSGTFLVSDTTRHQLVELAEDGESPVRRIGTGRRGFTDGPAERAEFSEPQGLALLGDGSVVVADTYNHVLRRYAPPTGEVSTLATDLREPSDAVVVGDDILVVESARHRLTRLRLPQDALGAGVGEGVRRETTEAAPGTLRLEVAFRAPAGQNLDLRYGPAIRLLVSATPPELLRAGEGAGTGLSRSLDLNPSVPEGVLHVSATAASCDDDQDVPYPACHVHQKEWKIPVRLVEGASDRLPLVLADVDTA